ncbi:MAG: GAF domain-containing protein [Acidobacteriaceae bacterium]|nr:GAF domain-containing protein [Acidobacteriaceae bacterium]
MHGLDPAGELPTQEFDRACARAAQAARSELISHLNQVFRRLRQYETENDWIAAVLDAASAFTREVALVSVTGETLSVRGHRRLGLTDDVTIPISSARAFASAIASRDAVIALRTAAEVGSALSTPDANALAHLVPLINDDRAVAVLFAVLDNDREGDSGELNALELIAGMASAVLERRANVSLNVQIAPAAKSDAHGVPLEAAKVPGASSPKQNGSGKGKRHLPPWFHLTEEQRGKHLRAQRFSRVKVAEMQLARPDACRAGREQNNIYLFLKKEIDAARESYRTQFLNEPSIVDYLHLELVECAAEGDESKLGPDYPGRLA